MQKNPACIVTELGWVENDNEKHIAVNCSTKKAQVDILNSTFYKNKENIYWSEVNELKEYNSSYGENAVAFHQTEFIHHIVRYPEYTPPQFLESLLFLLDICFYCRENGFYINTHMWNLT